MKMYGTAACLAALLISLVVAPVRSDPRATERTFELRFPVVGATIFDAVTNTGRVEVRAGGGSTVTVRGTIKRNVSWRGIQVTDDEIERLRATPPVRADGATVRIERIADEALWRGVSIDFEVVVPETAKVFVKTSSGAVSVDGSRSEVSVTTGSGAIRVAAAAGNVDVRSGSGAIRVSGAMDTLSMQTQSGSIGAEATSVSAVEVSSGSGSVAVSGVRGTVRAETGSSRITLDGTPTGDWRVRSRSGSVWIRVPAHSRFDLSARSRSGSVKAAHVVSGRSAASKHSVEGVVNGGGPKLDVETGSSSITLQL